MTDALFAELEVRIGDRRGLRIYRYARPVRPRWDEAGPLALMLIARPEGAQVVVGGRDVPGEIVHASPDDPVLCLVVPIDPALVRAVVTSARGVDMGTAASDTELTATAVRYVRSHRVESDRRVLVPLVLHELVYRVLKSAQGPWLVQLAARQQPEHPVAAAVTYINAHLAEPLTVDEVAAHVCLSASSFSRAFRQMTGRGPYQYVKEARLQRARQLLDDGRWGVAEVAHQVGYVSVSNFIKAFRGRFGATPGDYANSHPFRRAC